jgi:uncharacterized DUF497 family protein
MDGYTFSWDDEKNTSNIVKHGITFDEATTVFDDDDAIFIRDDVHSQDEDRFAVIGFSARLRLLIVCHCYRNGDTVVRIISARKANKSEEMLYGGKK